MLVSLKDLENALQPMLGEGQGLSCRPGHRRASATGNGGGGFEIPEGGEIPDGADPPLQRPAVRGGGVVTTDSDFHLHGP